MAVLISPLRTDRDKLRQLHAPGDFIEIYWSCPLVVCEKRDKKVLYARARAGEIKEITGILSTYEPPEHPDLLVDTDRETLARSAGKV